MNQRAIEILGQSVVDQLHAALGLSACLDAVKLAHYTSDQRQTSMVWVPHSGGGVVLGVIDRQGDLWSFWVQAGSFGLPQEQQWLFITPNGVAAWIACAWKVGVAGAPELWVHSPSEG